MKPDLWTVQLAVVLSMDSPSWTVVFWSLSWATKGLFDASLFSFLCNLLYIFFVVGDCIETWNTSLYFIIMC